MIKSTIQKILRSIRGEAPAETIARKQARIAAVATAESESISVIIRAELSMVRSMAEVSLKRIEALAATGALDADTNRRVIALHKALGTAQAAL